MRYFCYIFLIAISHLCDYHSCSAKNFFGQSGDTVASHQSSIIYCGPGESRHVVKGEGEVYSFLKKLAKYAQKHRINTIVTGRCKVDALGNPVSVRLLQHKRKNGKRLPARQLRKFKSFLQTKITWSINEEKTAGYAYLYLKIFPDSVKVAPNLISPDFVNACLELEKVDTF